MTRDLLADETTDPVATGRSPVPEHVQAVLLALRHSQSQPVTDDAYAAGMAFLRTYYGASRRPEDPIVAYDDHNQAVSIEFGDWQDLISGSVRVTGDGEYVVCFSNKETRQKSTVPFGDPASVAAHVVGQRAANRHVGMLAQPQPLPNIPTSPRSR